MTTYSKLFTIQQNSKSNSSNMNSEIDNIYSGLNSNDSNLQTHKTSGDHDSRYVQNTEVGSASGVASLDSGGHVPVSQLPVATSTAIGGVKQGANVTIDADGTLHTTAPYTLPVATSSVLGGVKQGSNVTIGGDGTISVAAPYALPIATSSTLGGVKQGSNVTIMADGTINAPAPYSLPIASSTVLGGVKQGANVTIDVDGTLHIAAPYTLPVATTTALGGVKQGSNVTIGADGTISVAAPYTLPVATSTTLGGVKQGTGISIAADGTISATGGGSGGSASIATTTTPGTVIVSDTNMTVDGSGNLGLTSNVAKLGTAQTWTAEQTFSDVKVSGLTGATAASRYVGGTTSGAPSTGTFAAGDYVIDQSGAIWVCTTAGTPGTWVKPNPFNQSLNTSSFPSFSGLTSTGNVTITNGSTLTVSGVTTLNKTNTATSGTNYASYALSFIRSYWNGTAAVNGTSQLKSDTSGNIVFTNESSANALSISQAGDGTFLNSVKAPYVSASGLTGATATSRYVGGTTSGAPSTGTFAVGDHAIDQTGKLWICTTAGTPGTWVPAGGSIATASDTALADTAAHTIATYTPVTQRNFSVKCYVRVVTAATNVTVTITYNDGGGAQTYTMQTGSLGVGSHSFPAFFFNATTGAAINVSVTAGTANQVYASASIVGE